VRFKNIGVSYNQNRGKKILFLSTKPNTTMQTCMNVHGRIKMFLELSHNEVPVLPESAWVACVLSVEQVETG
jgi:hypothetical protein